MDEVSNAKGFEMGAVSWDYVVPYQRDISQALQQLRQQVFASGTYYNRRAKYAEKLAHLRSIDDATYQAEINFEREHPEEQVLKGMIDMFPGRPPFTSEERAFYMNHIKEDIRMGTFFTLPPEEQTRDEAIAGIEQIIEQLPEVKAFDDVEALWYDGLQGTRSILDIDHIAPEFETHAVAPLKPETLMEIFGTERPTRELIDAHWHKVSREGPRRWEGLYIILWRDEIPDEILFHGCSPV